MPIGTIKKWVEEKGFGFIKPDAGGDDLFVHVSEFEKAGLGTPEEGDRVSFEIEPSSRQPGKSTAVNIRAA